jgi:WD40 repeat protein
MVRIRSVAIAVVVLSFIGRSSGPPAWGERTTLPVQLFECKSASADAGRNGPVSVQGQKPLVTLVGHVEGIDALSFSADGKTLASVGRDSVKLWNRATNGNIVTIKAEDPKESIPYLWGTVAFSPDGKKLAIGGAYDKVKLWDVATQKSTLLRDHKRQLAEPWVMFSPDGQALVTGVQCHGYISLFDVATGRTKATFGAGYYLVAMALNPDGKTLVTASAWDEIKFWDVATGKNTNARKTSAEFPNAAAAFSRDCKILVTMSDMDGDIKLWEVATGKERATLKGHAARVRSVAFSADGEILASGDKDGTIKLWTVTGGKELATLKAHTSAVQCIAFSEDSEVLASGSTDKTIKLWNTPKAK